MDLNWTTIAEGVIVTLLGAAIIGLATLSYRHPRQYFRFARLFGNTVSFAAIVALYMFDRSDPALRLAVIGAMVAVGYVTLLIFFPAIMQKDVDEDRSKRR